VRSSYADRTHNGRFEWVRWCMDCAFEVRGYRDAPDKMQHSGAEEDEVLTRIRAFTASLLIGAALFGSVPAASAQPVIGDGLVNVQIGSIDVLTGDITITRVVEDVNVGVAAQIAANVCGLKVGPLAVLGSAVDRSGATRTACTTGTQIVQFTQN